MITRVGLNMFVASAVESGLNFRRELQSQRSPLFRLRKSRST